MIHKHCLLCFQQNLNGGVFHLNRMIATEIVYDVAVTVKNESNDTLSVSCFWTYECYVHNEAINEINM